MSNEVAKSEGGPVGLAGLASGLKRSRSSRPSYRQSGYLKMGKDGVWQIGKNGPRLNDQRVMLNPLTLMEGFLEVESTAKKYAVHDERMALLTEPSITMADLPATDHEWKFQRSIQGRVFEEGGENFTYSVSSHGGLQAMEVITDVIEERLSDGETVYLFPIVELDTESYEHDEWGRTYVPILDTVAWADTNGNLEGEPVMTAVEKAPEEEPKEAEAASEPEVDKAPADEPPVRRRRRR